MERIFPLLHSTPLTYSEHSYHRTGAVWAERLALLGAGEVDTEKDNSAAYDFIGSQALGEEDNTGDHTRQGDEVLVDEHPVGPDAAYPPLPGGEGEGGRKYGRVSYRGLRPQADTPPLHAREIRDRQKQDDRPPKEGRVGGYRQRRVALEHG